MKTFLIKYDIPANWQKCLSTLTVPQVCSSSTTIVVSSTTLDVPIPEEPFLKSRNINVSEARKMCSYQLPTSIQMQDKNSASFRDESLGDVLCSLCTLSLVVFRLMKTLA